MRVPFVPRELHLGIATAALMVLAAYSPASASRSPSPSFASPASAGLDAPPPCVAADLTATGQVGIESTYYQSTLGGTIVFTNASSQPCELQGIPVVRIVDASGATLSVAQTLGTGPPPPGPLVILRPEGKAFSSIAWTNFCQQPPPPGPYSLRVTLPVAGTLAAPFSSVPPFTAVPPGPPCEAPASPSTIAVAPFQPVVPRDQRFFPQTAYRIDNDTIWDYFTHRGGVSTFGYPVSRTFEFGGFATQFFQRRIVQVGPDGAARLLNLLDPGLMPYTQINRATFPASDPTLVAAAPPSTDTSAVLAFVAAHAPSSFEGMPVNFYGAFLNTVSYAAAFQNGGGDARLLAGLDLEMWGIPTSLPAYDPNNHNFVYLRWQRGIMMYDAGCNCTRGVLIGDYFKHIITGDELPPDLAQEAQGSPFYRQYTTSGANWVRDPSLLPNTNLIDAFAPE
jgi:hypothetical protein